MRRRLVLQSRPEQALTVRRRLPDWSDKRLVPRSRVQLVGRTAMPRVPDYVKDSLRLKAEPRLSRGGRSRPVGAPTETKETKAVGAPNEDHHSSEGTFDRQADGPTDGTRRRPTDLAREAKTGRLWRAGPLAWGRANRPSKTTRNTQGNHRAQSTINKTVNLTGLHQKDWYKTYRRPSKRSTTTRIWKRIAGPPDKSHQATGRREAPFWEGAGRVARDDGPTG